MLDQANASSTTTSGAPASLGDVPVQYAQVEIVHVLCCVVSFVRSIVTHTRTRFSSCSFARHARKCTRTDRSIRCSITSRQSASCSRPRCGVLRSVVGRSPLVSCLISANISSFICTLLIGLVSCCKQRTSTHNTTPSSTVFGSLADSFVRSCMRLLIFFVVVTLRGRQFKHAWSHRRRCRYLLPATSASALSALVQVLFVRIRRRYSYLRIAFCDVIEKSYYRFVLFRFASTNPSTKQYGLCCHQYTLPFNARLVMQSVSIMPGACV